MNQIEFLVIIGSVVMLLLIISFLLVFNINQRKKLKYQNDMQQLREKQQNQLIESAIRSEENERHRIAETLHDEVGAILSSTRLHFSNIKTDQLDEKDRQLHEKSKELLDHAINHVRSISHNLHSTLLKEFGLNEAIRHFLNKTVQGTVVKVETNLDDNYLVQHPQTDLGMYRIVQELVNNILKHAHANYIDVSSILKEEENWKDLVMTIRYNGSGISQEEFEDFRYKPEGLGLKNIQNRIILLRGKIQFQKNTTDNTITLTIPINNVL
jgi:two-component system, NarL family, sensor kinase